MIMAASRRKDPPESAEIESPEPVQRKRSEPTVSQADAIARERAKNLHRRARLGRVGDRR